MIIIHKSFSHDVQSLQSLAYLAFICAIHMFSQSLFPHAKVSTFHNDFTLYNAQNTIKTDTIFL